MLVDGTRVAQLSGDDFHVPTMEDLLDCIVNQDQVLPLLRLPGQRFKGAGSRQQAATVIQSNWRMRRDRKRYLARLHQTRAARTILSMWQTHLVFWRTKQRVKAKAEVDAEIWKEQQGRLRQLWPEMHFKRRVVVHMNSLSLDPVQRMTYDDFRVMQNSQVPSHRARPARAAACSAGMLRRAGACCNMLAQHVAFCGPPLQLSRICDIADPLVDVVYVSPFPVSDDLRQYYMKVLQIGGIEGVEQRFTIVYPENYDRFPAHFSLATTVLYSPKCIKRIRHLAHGKYSYVVPGVVGPDEVRLAVELGMPMLTADVELSMAYASKSGAKRVFQARLRARTHARSHARTCTHTQTHTNTHAHAHAHTHMRTHTHAHTQAAGVNIAPSAYDLYDENEVIAALAQLIFDHIHLKQCALVLHGTVGSSTTGYRRTARATATARLGPVLACCRYE